MNARIAIEENERITRQFLEEVKEFSERTGRTLKDSFTFKLDLRIKWSNNNNEANAWEIRGREVSKALGLDEEDKNIMKKEELIKVIAKELYDSEEDYGVINAISTENNYKDVAERIVNKFFIHGCISNCTDKENETL